MVASGDEAEGTGCTMFGGVGGTAKVDVVGLFPARAAVAVEGKRTVFASTVVAARPRRHGDDDGGGAS